MPHFAPKGKALARQPVENTGDLPARTGTLQRAIQRAADPTDLPTPQRRSPPYAMEKPKKCKVLLVDDEEIFREATARQLSVRGFVVLTAADGPAALDLIRNDPPEVVVLDQMMPEMSGAETLVAIKRLNPLIEIIMLSGNTSVDEALELMQLGSFDYLMKPVNLEELLYKIEDARARKQLNERRMEAANRP